jgi:hypothetical protein
MELEKSHSKELSSHEITQEKVNLKDQKEKYFGVQRYAQFDTTTTTSTTTKPSLSNSNALKPSQPENNSNNDEKCLVM